MSEVLPLPYGPTLFYKGQRTAAECQCSVSQAQPGTKGNNSPKPRQQKTSQRFLNGLGGLAECGIGTFMILSGGVGAYFLITNVDDICPAGSSATYFRTFFCTTNTDSDGYEDATVTGLSQWKTSFTIGGVAGVNAFCGTTLIWMGMSRFINAVKG